MKRVVIESPFAGDVERNLRYLRACMHHSITHDEAPYASHGLYTQPGVLDDQVPRERELGIVAGFCWRDVADLTVVYTDLGVSSGMQYGIDDAVRKGRPVEYRELGGEWKTPRIYVFCNGCSPGWHHFVAITEDGDVPAGHLCSAHGYAMHDMGVNHNGWKRDLYAALYPDGFVVEYVEVTSKADVEKHAGLQAAFAKCNAKQAALVGVAS